jgi:hypothetical protein
MKKSELRQIIREEIQKLTESDMKKKIGKDVFHRKMTSSDDEGSSGDIYKNGKKIAKYLYDSMAGGFWVYAKTPKAKEVFDSWDEIFDYMSKNPNIKWRL